MNNSILIVEDEGLIAHDLKNRLERAGYCVPLIADNGTDALLAVARLQPSLVLMDIRLLGPQDGIETADQIRRRFHVPVMFVTSHADNETLDRARITEPFGYIVKPFNNVNFRAQIEMALWKHRMEQKLRISEAWLSTTFRNVADALIATDSEGNIAFMNAPAARLTGWDWNESKGKPLLEVFEASDEATDAPVAHHVDAIRGGSEPGASPRTLQLRTRGGSGPVLVEAELSANRDEESLLGIIVVFRDITERRRAEKQNRQLQKMNSLALMAIGLGRELEESQRRIDDSLKYLIAESHGSALSLLRDVYQFSSYQQSIVQQLIALGRTEPPEAVSVDLNGLLTAMEARFRKALGSRRSLNLKLRDGIPPVMVDPQGLRDSLFRLVADARQAMPDRGVVEISTTTTHSLNGRPGVQVAIRDTGKGIRAHATERIFDPYFQSRPGAKSPGFSLALVYQFVALSGGSIEVESASGNGAGYLLSFPLAEDLQAPPRRFAAGSATEA